MYVEKPDELNPEVEIYIVKAGQSQSSTPISSYQYEHSLEHLEFEAGLYMFEEELDRRASYKPGKKRLLSYKSRNKDLNPKPGKAAPTNTYMYLQIVNRTDLETIASQCYNIGHPKNEDEHGDDGREGGLEPTMKINTKTNALMEIGNYYTYVSAAGVFARRGPKSGATELLYRTTLRVVAVTMTKRREDVWSRDLLFTGPEKLFKYKKRKGESTLGGLAATRKFLQQHQTYQLHKPARKRFLRRKVIVSGPNEMVDADLLDLVDLKGQNYKQRYLLTVVDVFSKKAYAQHLSSKEASKTAAAFEKLLRDNDTLHPRKVRTDHGSEFKGAFDKLVATEGIKHVLTNSPDIKANYVERFHRTFRDKLTRYLTFSKSSNWTRVYQRLIDSYNNTPHSTLKNLAPNDVNESNVAQLWDAMYGPYFTAAADEKVAKLTGRKKNKFKEGEYVRVAIFKKGFTKASRQTFTDELYEISEIIDSYPTTYRLKDLSGEKIMGSYYEPELQSAERDALEHRRIDAVSSKPDKRGLYKVHFTNWPEKFDLVVNADELEKLIKKD